MGKIIEKIRQREYQQRKRMIQNMEFDKAMSDIMAKKSRQAYEDQMKAMQSASHNLNELAKLQNAMLFGSALSFDRYLGMQDSQAAKDWNSQPVTEADKPKQPWWKVW